MNLYALALSATRKGETYIIPAHAYANDKTEARDAGVELVKKQFPIEEGFANHAAMADLIDDAYLRAVGWVKKSTAKRVKRQRAD